MKIDSVPIQVHISPLLSKIMTPQAAKFLAVLHEKFNPQRLALLNLRSQRQQALDEGILPAFPTNHPARQDSNWLVAPPPADLQQRWVEITGPTDAKMMINALNSGADVFMADFEDANAPTWKNMLEGQHHLIEAVAGRLSLTTPEGKCYQLNDKLATLMVRPRGWHLLEKHCLVEGQPISASLFDFGLYFFHNATALLKKNTAPYFYLPKLENHLEARLWNDIFLFAQQELKIPKGTIRATVLIETILAAFEMTEILYELREHSAGLNAGRWDYIFSIIKKFHHHKNFLFPDRAQITMSVPFMQSYTKLLVQTCHRHGAHAIGGMAAFIPSRKDAALNATALAKVREDKLRESAQGFDGTWVAHPDLVPLAHDIFKEALHGQPHQKTKQLDEAHINADDLLNFNIAAASITEDGMRKNISIALQYLHAWLGGMGAVALFNLMEDAATAEISRAQLWQWVHHPNAQLADGRVITKELYQSLADQELENITALYPKELLSPDRLGAARGLLDQLVLEAKFAEFMTSPAYDILLKEVKK